MPEKKNDKIKEEIEAIVFSDARGAEIHSLAKHLKVSGKMVRESIEELAADYKKRGSGLSLAWDEKRVQMATSESFSDSVAKFHQKKNEAALSGPALEVLAITAYRGPISTAGIDYIRGVNSRLIVRKLAMQGLIEREENPDDSRSFLYKTGLDFLKSAGLNKLEDLPDYDKLSKEELSGSV